MRRALVLTTLLATACAGTARIRVRYLPGPTVAADAIAVLPLRHRFRAAAHQWFSRALPLCAAALARGGLRVYGPNEARVTRRRAGNGHDLFARLVLPRALVREGLDPARLLLVRGFAEERIAKTAKLLLDRAGRPRGGLRQVDVVLRVVLEVLAPPDGAVLARAVGEIQEDPFATVPDHDPRPAIRALVRKLAPRLLVAAARRIKAPRAGPPPLDAALLPSPRVLEGFRLRGESTLAERARREPVLGAGLRDVYRRGLGEEVSSDELAVLAAEPGGVLVRDSWQGLLPGDVVLAVAGTRVRTPWALQRALEGSPVGGRVLLRRGGRRLRLPLAAVVGRVGAAAAGAGRQGG